MLEQFKQYCNEGKTMEALLIGQNLFCKNSSDVQIFADYFSYLLMLSQKQEFSIEERENYLDRAGMVLSFHSENVEMSDNALRNLMLYHTKLAEAKVNLDTDNHQMRVKQLKQRVAENTNVLHQLEGMIEKLRAVQNKAEFNKILEMMEFTDHKLKKEMLTEKQTDKYHTITEQCSALVNRKMKQFERKENTEYNLEAIEVYEKTYLIFKKGMSYSDHEDIMRRFFSFDASKLFNETLVYYNHVYSYILSCLNDEDKLKLTKLSILGKKGQL